MAPTTTVTEYDLGKQMKCLVSVTDKGIPGSDPITVESNSTIAAFRPTLGDYYSYVDDVLVEDAIGLTPSQICACLVQEDDPVLYPPKDVTFKWESVQALAALAVTPTCPCWLRCTGLSSAGALVTCAITSHHAQDAQSAQIEFLISGP